MSNAAYVLVVVQSGLLDSVDLFETEEEALKAGQARWQEETGTPSMAEDRHCSEEEQADIEPGYQPEYGGVVRGYVMHWWSEEGNLDIWVVETGEPKAACRELEDLAYIEWARIIYGKQDEIEIDDDAKVSHAHNHDADAPCHNADDHGAYVQAWVWVEAEEEE